MRAGDLRIEFRGMAFIGADSEKALRAALAAGEQDRLWNVLDLLYLNQGAENSGWVTDDLIAAVGRSVPGLDGAQMQAGMSSQDVTDALQADADASAAAGITGTPSFELGRTGGELTPRGHVARRRRVSRGDRRAARTMSERGLRRPSRCSRWPEPGSPRT